jgi:hypothetical protein
LAEPVWTYTSRTDFRSENVTVSPTLSYPDEYCRDVLGESCEQEWSIKLNADMSPPVCDFTGDWTVTFTMLCEPSLVASNTCPLPFVDGRYQSTGYVSFHLTTESFCPTVFADVRLSASLASFQEHGHTIVKDNFISGATAYFVATVSSPDATIVETSLLTVRSDATTLYDTDGGVHLSVFTPENFPRSPTVSSHPTQSWFSIVLDPTVFPVAVDSSASFSVWATLNVVFANTGAGGGFHTRQFTVLLERIMAESDGGSNPVDARAVVQMGPALAAGSASAVASSGLLLVALAAYHFAL